ncbi:hypothetical protein [Bacterioplanoides sp. SCSIO 12839]|uniref:hypothetical protein n=1 Tax=Bacterioplanoides sp. SCSIO 12839 TaxID=2829569 RepID=UPI002104CF19|nr:hypothetical protein [Bacterioplanoides sp. SCSIO 12839]UTW49299.1 hypothetical protein KFF03_05180 [Bacterioplanoides sp. SCSIO 12839]
MAQALKDQYGPEVIHWLAQQIAAVSPPFDADGFIAQALPGYDTLELMPRGKHIAVTLKDFLPDDYAEAMDILVRSMGEKLTDTRSFGMSSFYYLPHSFYIAEFGLDYFDESMAAMYELTQRFTAEFCIRPFILRDAERTLKQLTQWLNDPSEHVRRLISEGTRPRLPWGIALKPFKQDPLAILPLLEQLKDDESLYVRRSVANNLNDIGKDNLDVLCHTCTTWLQGADSNRRWLVNHALRSAIKRGEPKALAVLGYGSDIDITLSDMDVTPQHAQQGDSLQISFSVTNNKPEQQALLVDFAIHYVKANGQTNPKVFKLKTVELQPQETMSFSKKVSLRNMTTRKHYSGRHQVQALLNGVAFDLKWFDLQLDG